MTLDETERSKIIQGTLRKRRQKGSWKEHLFVLRAQDGTLGFFENDGSSEVSLKGKIKIRNALIQSDQDTNFVVTTAAGVSYVLQAEAMSVKEKWLAVLARAASGCSNVDELREIWDDTQVPENENELLRQLDSPDDDLSKVETRIQTEEEEPLEKVAPPPPPPPPEATKSDTKQEDVETDQEYFGQGELSAALTDSPHSQNNMKLAKTAICGLDCFYPSCLPRPSWL